MRQAFNHFAFKNSSSAAEPSIGRCVIDVCGVAIRRKDLSYLDFVAKF